jgi:hypothetical protein
MDVGAGDQDLLLGRRLPSSTGYAVADGDSETRAEYSSLISSLLILAKGFSGVAQQMLI